MFDTDEDHRHTRTASGAPAARRKAGSLLSAPVGVHREEDAVERHGRARALREKLAAVLPSAADAAPETAVARPAVAEPAQRVDLAPEAEARADTEERPAGGSSKVIGLTLAGALAGTALAFAWPSAYVATSEMLIDPGEAAQVDNQVRVLRSGTMLNAAAERLNLAADSEFNGTGGGLPGLGDLLAGEGAATAEQRRRHAVEALGKAVEIGRDGASSVLTVSASTSDPQKSALIANTITELFVETAGRQPDDGSERLAQLREAVVEAERAIEAFKAQKELVDAQGRLITDDEIARLGEQLSAARARTVELNARAASTREANVDSIVTGSLPEQYASPALADLRVGYAAAKQQVDRLSARLGPRHPDRLSAEAELEGARQEIAAELRRVASSLQTELTRAVQQEQELAGQLARMKVRQGDIGEDLVRLRELERDAELKRSAYERAFGAAQGMPSAGAASIISRAEAPLEATGPSMPAFSLAGALAGLLAGIGLTGWRRADRTARADDEAETQSDASQDHTSGAVAAEDKGKEADAMYPYPPYAAQQMPQPSAQSAQQHDASPQAAAAPAALMQPPYAAAPYLHPQQAMQPGYPQQPAPPMQQPGWPAAHHPAPPAQQYWQLAQLHQPSMPQHDPWAAQQGVAPQAYPGPAYAPPMQTVVYVPAPPHYAPAPQAAYQPQQQPAPRQPSSEPRWRDQDAFVDERTNAAIEEIRQSLREFREAIEDFADERDRHTHRRFGT